MPGVHFSTLTEGRAHFSELLDASEAGKPASVTRDKTRSAVVDAARLRAMLAVVVPSTAEVVAEGGGWSAFIPGLPLAGDGETFDDALDELVAALREYAADWSDRLLTAPNHKDNWGLVQLVTLSDDQQLKDWIVGA